MRPLADRIRSSAEPLPPITSPSFATFFDRFSECKLVLLGDSTHGTSEFYTARAQITKRLVEQHGFTIVAAEADWPDAETLDQYIRHGDSEADEAHLTHMARHEAFKRFPTWMWRNEEMRELIEWMRTYNMNRAEEKRVGFYGLDLYSMRMSMHAVLDYLETVDPQMAATAQKRYACLDPWVEDPAEYGLAALSDRFASCEKQVLRVLRDLLAKRLEYSAHRRDGRQFHSAEQNARLVADAERYYRAMYYSSADSWNLRDTHMFETLQRLLKFNGKNAKAIVWAHNSHLGDARYTSMGTRRNELNIGQLCRQVYGHDAALIGFGTHTGTVAAAHRWGGPVHIMPVQPSLPHSVERLAHDCGVKRFLLDLREGRCDEETRARLAAVELLERFIGVLYLPKTERQSHYSTVVLPGQFDAYVWMDETRAVRPLERRQPRTDVTEAETFPFGE